MSAGLYPICPSELDITDATEIRRSASYPFRQYIFTDGLLQTRILLFQTLSLEREKRKINKSAIIKKYFFLQTSKWISLLCVSLPKDLFS